MTYWRWQSMIAWIFVSLACMGESPRWQWSLGCWAGLLLPFLDFLTASLYQDGAANGRHAGFLGSSIGPRLPVGQRQGTGAPLGAAEAMPCARGDRGLPGLAGLCVPPRGSGQVVTYPEGPYPAARTAIVVTVRG